MTAPLSMEQIRTAMDRARALAGREDTEKFALEAPALLARLLEALDLYVGHEPTLAEEAHYAASETARLTGIEDRARELVAELEDSGLVLDLLPAPLVLDRLRGILADPTEGGAPDA
jgi:hypothetical protein